jgi:hypothetical protein
MKQTGIFVPSHLPALTYNESGTKAIESNSKPNPSSTVQNGDTIDNQSKYKQLGNGFLSIPRTHRLNSNTERISNTSRRTSKERQLDTKLSKYPPRTQ